MDIRKIRKLIDLMIESDLQSLEVKEGENSIAMARRLPEPAVIQAPEPAPVIQTKAQTPTGTVECAPMVGVFYTAPNPNEPNFIKVGQAVKAGDTLGIIEAMKIMNPLEATQSGVIAEVLVQNGEVVQYGQPIVRYKS